MGRNKQRRFEENAVNFNVLEPGKAIYEKIKGNWRSYQFKNDLPIVVEMACGNGEYTVGLARIFPQKNFIGVDIKGARIWKGSTIALEEGLDNVAFLRTQIQLVEKFFEEGEVNEIWITFPDPRPKLKDEKLRLMHPRFLEIYKKIMKPGGTLFLKTDNIDFFNYSLEVINERDDVENLKYTFDLYQSSLASEHYGIRTKYEKIFHENGHDIKYLRFNFRE